MIDKGMLITFEGGEGCGKSTQIRRLAASLRGAGLDVREVREPGGTLVGEAVRHVVLDPGHGSVDPVAELMLYEASRAQNVAEVVRPAMRSGQIVLLDRFYDSSTAYQGFGRGIGREEVEAMNRIATGGLVPDLTLLLDIDPVEGIRRATGRGADRLEQAGAEFHACVREGFLTIAADEPDRFAVIDASGSLDDIEELVLAEVVSRLPRVAAALGESRA
ncbi:MAG: dTMP kinase [Actinomycetota bacterium]|jgi:dTMP kinase|nr:dTMP kinase [Actinomycetota bacterium]